MRVHQRLALVLTALLCLAAFTLLAQSEGTERQADFLMRWQGDELQFKPVLPPLVPIAGAPAAYYEHYWEFGDGQFSFEETPAHTYTDTGEHEVFYLATGKYDNGKAPKSRKKKAPAAPSPPKAKEAMAALSPEVLPKRGGALGLRAVRNPRAGEEMVCVLGYTNPWRDSQSGTLYFFFNQQAYPNAHFRFAEARAHFGEYEQADALTWEGPPLRYEAWTGSTEPSSLWAIQLPEASPDRDVRQLRKSYRNAKAWRYENLQPGELRHLFFSLDATSAMVADTNAIITLSALMVSDDQRTVETYELELEIVASHDPNYMAVSKPRTSIRGIEQQAFEYKVHFQNTGEGPASRVAITADVPPGLDANSLVLLETSPACGFCPEAEVSWSCIDTTMLDDKLVFTFRNIYLPGTKQQGVKDRDSTQGFVKYRLSPSSGIRKLTMSPRASIVFDQNPPIVTQSAPTRFKKNWSPGFMAGWTHIRPSRPNNRDQPYYSLGLSLSPFKSAKPFYQAELWGGRSIRPAFSATQSSDTLSSLRDIPGLPFLANVDSVSTRIRDTEFSALYFHIVPLQLRKTVKPWLALGGGLALDFNILESKADAIIVTERFVYDREGNTTLPDFYERSEARDPFNFDELTFSFESRLFADVQLGQVEQGLSLTLRLYFNSILFDGEPLSTEIPVWTNLFLAWRF